jgi:hypothetical protein
LILILGTGKSQKKAILARKKPPATNSSRLGPGYGPKSGLFPVTRQSPKLAAGQPERKVGAFHPEGEGKGTNLGLVYFPHFAGCHHLAPHFPKITTLPK